MAGNLRVKQVRLGDGDRFVICHNPEAACHDAAVRARLVERLAEMIAGSDKLTATKRAELRGVISTKPGLNRFLRTTPGGLLRVDAQAITAEAKLDGKYLLRSNDPHLSAEDIALGYKQLLEVERGWRDMKQILDLRPVHHRLEDRIRAQVTLCWLALLLIRIAETTTGADLEQPAPRAATPPRRLLHRPRRQLLPDHRGHPRPAAHPHPARAGRPAADPGPRHHLSRPAPSS